MARPVLRRRKWVKCTRCGQRMLEENAVYLGGSPAPYGPKCAELTLRGLTPPGPVRNPFPWE